MKLSVPTVDAAIFSYSRKRKVMSAEMSDLGRINTRQRLYDDACDEGFAVANPITGAVTRWTYSHEERDNEGDLIQETYIPTPETEREYPALKGYKLILFND